MTVVRDAANIVRAFQQHLPWYAGDFAPVRTDQIAELIRRSGCYLQIFDFPRADNGEPIDPAFVTPPVFGVNIICVDRSAPRIDRQYAIRHELAHVYAGEVQRLTYLTARDYMSESERRADLVAFADLIPAWLLRALRRDMTWSAIRDDVAQTIRQWYGEDWNDARVNDRTDLRLKLFRTYNL